ncbi:MAG: LuxR C-terminal-related transcriptional regulator [Tannerellaceae bacterium]|jgi:DNA-binding CsgD family transcriptional regulator|nr:LuxR C-terminal-related transcriptional regulator [Tannerellaceae bacterium]
MRRTKQIAVILSDTLQCAGLNSLLTDYFPPVNIADFRAFDDLPENGTGNGNGTDFHYYLTQADTFALNIDFFLPRRSRTLILTAGKAASPAAGCNCLDTGAPKEALIEQLQQFFSSEDTQNTVAERNKELSMREKDVLKLIAQGNTNKDIADKLNISLNTVLTHRKNITARLGIKTVSGLTFYAIMNGLVSSDAIG